MKSYTSLKKDFNRDKEIITKEGKVKFNNTKSHLITKGFKKSSQKWLGRQLNDPFANAAKIEGYLARSAYKLLEIQNKYCIINDNTNIIIDLGCSPGSWSQVILTNKKLQGKKVIGVDLLPIKFQHKDLYFIQGDFEDKNIQQEIVNKITAIKQEQKNKNNTNNENNKNNKKDKNNTKIITKADCVICDIALNNIGNAEIDRLRSERIIELAIIFCKKHLLKGGNFVCKSLKGADSVVFGNLKQMFEQSYRFKPKSSRQDSSEMFLVGINKI